MTANVLIVAGQSNALGFRVTPGELPADYHPDAHVHIWTDAGWQTMTPGVNTGTPANPDAWGPEVGEALAWAKDHPGEDLYVIKSVKGSTGLASDPTAQDWSPQSKGDLFDMTTAKIKAALAALTDPHVIAVDWVQGEQDATAAAPAGAYLANELDFFDHVRAAWAEADTPIIYSRLDVADGLPFQDQVRAAQDAAAGIAHNVYEVDTDGFGQQGDHLHFTGAGQLALGDALYGELPHPDISDFIAQQVQSFFSHFVFA